MGSKEPMLKRRTALCLQVISLSKVIIVPNDCSTRKIINMMILPSKYTKSASFSVVKTGLFVKSWTNNNFFLQSHCIWPIYPFCYKGSVSDCFFLFISDVQLIWITIDHDCTVTPLFTPKLNHLHSSSHSHSTLKLSINYNPFWASPGARFCIFQHCTIG